MSVVFPQAGIARQVDHLSGRLSGIGELAAHMGRACFSAYIYAVIDQINVRKDGPITGGHHSMRYDKTGIGQQDDLGLDDI